MKKGHSWFDNIWTIQHRRNGKVIYEEIQRNSLADQGESAMLELFFRNDSAYTPAQFYVRLCNDTLEKTDTLATVLNEASGNGYTAQLIERSAVGFRTKELNEGYYRLTSKELTFTAVGGDIGPVTTAYLATTTDNSGLLICFKPLKMSRTVLSGDEMVVQMRIKLK
jgi:hypothetical protein